MGRVVQTPPICPWVNQARDGRLYCFAVRNGCCSILSNSIGLRNGNSMSIRRSSITVFVAMFAASTLSACGDQRQDDAQGPGQEASASAGSGLISAQSGFAEMDLASVKAVKSFGLRSEEHTSELQSLMRIS